MKTSTDDDPVEAHSINLESVVDKAIELSGHSWTIGGARRPQKTQEDDDKE